MTAKIESIDWDDYVDIMSAMIGLPIATSDREATIAQLKLNAAIAEPLLAFDIPEGTNPAPVFKP
jgi:1-carboxybiuret hydrolase subunit AtzG-like protein